MSSSTTKSGILITNDGSVFSIPPNLLQVFQQVGEFLMPATWGGPGLSALQPVTAANTVQTPGTLYAVLTDPNNTSGNQFFIPADDLGGGGGGGVNYGFTSANAGLIISEQSSSGTTFVDFTIAVAANSGLAVSSSGLGMVLANPGTVGGINGVSGATLANGFLTITNSGTGGATYYPGTNITFSGTAPNQTINASGTLAGGLPTPGTGSIIGTISGNEYVVIESASGGEPLYITPTNFINSLGSFPTVANTATLHTSDLFVVYQGGTVANVGSLGGLAQFVLAYQSANQPIIALTTPGTVSHASSFTVPGTLENYGTTPTLTVSIDSGAFGTLAAGSSYNSSTLSLVIGTLSIGSHTVQVEDQNGFKSNAISVYAQ